MKNIGVILAAGASERFRSTVHKQYLKLNGKEVIFYTIQAMRDAGCFDEIIATVDEDEYREGYIARKYNIECIPGGKRRNDSIWDALEYIKTHYQCDKVIFHDCARPFVKKEIFSDFIGILDQKDAVSITTPISDSLVTTDGEFVDRRAYSLIQTPEAFRFNKLYSDFSAKNNDTAIINQLSDKSNIMLCKNSFFNFKITYPEDLFLAEQLMRINYVHVKSNDYVAPRNLNNVLLLGGSGGVGQAVIGRLEQMNVRYFAPSHKQLDLLNFTPAQLMNVCPFAPDVIINVAAAYASDDAGLLETFDEIFTVNLKANLILIEYAKLLGKNVNLVLMSSSSSTRGREHLTNYSAAKAALNSIVESQGNCLHERGIVINAIIPEKINTPLIEKLHKTAINTRELLDVDEVLDAIIKFSVTNEYGKLVHIRKGL